MSSTLPVYQTPTRKRSWILDSLIMLLFATTIAFLLVMLGKSSGGDAIASQKISEQLQTVSPSENLPDALPQAQMRGAVKAQNALLDPFAPIDETPSAESRMNPPADAYAEDFNALAKAGTPAMHAEKQIYVKPAADHAISLQDQQEILKILTGEATDETTR